MADGHWALIVGHNADETVYFVNDPFGEMDIKNGGYFSPNGKMVKYSVEHFNKRWMADGPSTGWMIKIDRVL